MPNTETTVINQFAINNIIQTPCDAVFLNLLSLPIIIDIDVNNDHVII